MMKEQTATVEGLASSVEASPSSDFTLFNVSSTIQEVLAEAHVPTQTNSRYEISVTS